MELEPLRKAAKKAPCPLYHASLQLEDAVQNPESGLSPDTESAGTLIWNFPSS